MTDESATGGRLPFEIFVGERAPDHWSEIEAHAKRTGVPPFAAIVAARGGRNWQRPNLARESFPWGQLGALPRFVGNETATCVAALQPSIFQSEGADELDRFLAATSKRGELALLVSMVGSADPNQPPRSARSRYDASVSLPGLTGSICGRRLPAGASAEVADDVRGADRDLALRLHNRDALAPWWAIELTPTLLEGPDGTETHEPGGRIKPLLVDALGETLAGVWIPDSGQNWRWYFVPGGTEWEDVVAWLVEQAIPEYVPDALRRTRSEELIDDEFLTAHELAARDELVRFEDETDRVRGSLTRAQQAARLAAKPTRFGLLYGTGKALVGAVSEVLSAARFHVEDLDATFGAGISADLLVSRDSRHWLVEVKAAAGNASEGLLADLDRHERTWPELGRPERLEGSVLVINHQHNRVPLERAAQPYTRPEFLASLHHSVVPTLTLFSWWRDMNYEEVVEAVTGRARCHSVDLAQRAGASAASEETSDSSANGNPVPSPRRWWHKRS